MFSSTIKDKSKSSIRNSCEANLTVIVVCYRQKFGRFKMSYLDYGCLKFVLHYMFWRISKGTKSGRKGAEVGCPHPFRVT